MNDDLESKVNVRDHALDGHYGETLLYDFAKMLTSLSLLVLGGVLTLAGSQQAADIPYSVWYLRRVRSRSLACWAFLLLSELLKRGLKTENRRGIYRC